jgi:hypothetical protein
MSLKKKLLYAALYPLGAALYVALNFHEIAYRVKTKTEA